MSTDLPPHEPAVRCGERSTSSLRAAALAGAATGLRSQIALASILGRTPRDRLPEALRRPAVRRLALLTSLAELVADKHPGLPRRTEPASLGLRIVLGATAAGLLARADDNRLGVPCILGAAAATVSAFAGLAARETLTRRRGPWTAALLEDAVATAMALAAGAGGRVSSA